MPFFNSNVDNRDFGTRRPGAGRHCAETRRATFAIQAIRFGMGIAVGVAVFAIRCYQAIIRPHLIGSCKFHPTCSEYAIDAIVQHGLFRGLELALRRVSRCQPFTPGGLDPVPMPNSKE